MGLVFVAELRAARRRALGYPKRAVFMENASAISELIIDTIVRKVRHMTYTNGF
jgi:hypothetical protein